MKLLYEPVITLCVQEEEAWRNACWEIDYLNCICQKNVKTLRWVSVWCIMGKFTNSCATGFPLPDTTWSRLRSQKKGPKAVTGTVPFQKVNFCPF